MDKLQMAHDWAMKRLNDPDYVVPMDQFASDAWRYADAMEAEYNKRQAKQNRSNIDALCGGGSKWQPDWSVAPDQVTLWRMHANGLCSWGCVAESTGYSFQVPHSEAPDFGYTGKWQDSLRKRPTP